MVFSRRQVMGTLSETFGHRDFRAGQADVIRSVINARPTIAVLPTGAGKSLCYQLPGCLFPGTTLVISPLIALMRDQIHGLQAKGIPSASFDSAQNEEERAHAEMAFRSGELRFLYVSPERLANQRFLHLLQSENVKIPLVAIDEAHCVSRWGHDFRPAYLEIEAFLKRLNPPNVAAFTATATPELRQELGGALGFENPQIFVRGFLRENIFIETYQHRSEQSRQQAAYELVKDRSGTAPALIYAGTRRGCEEMVAYLQSKGLRAAFYHGGWNGDERQHVQKLFIDNEVDALVATNAFGMGIDKAHLRLLIHLHLPPSFEDYYQEFGRVGRDGEAARAVLLWRGKDYRTHDFLINQEDGDGNQPDPRLVEARTRRLQRVYEWAQAGSCSWRRVLNYFGDPAVEELGEDCQQCCRCRRRVETPTQVLEGTEAFNRRLILDAIANWQQHYGRRKCAAIFSGSKASGIPTHVQGYGQLASCSQSQVDELIQELIDNNYLCSSGSEYPVLILAKEGVKVLQGESELVGQVKVTASPLEGLAVTLKAWRRAKAAEWGRPAFHILTNKVLDDVATAQPTTEAELLQVNGIGPKKIESIGFELLETIRQELKI